MAPDILVVGQQPSLLQLHGDFHFFLPVEMADDGDVQSAFVGGGGAFAIF